MRLFCLAVLAVSCFGQGSSEKVFYVPWNCESVNASAKQLSIVNDPVPGGMESMTMSNSVDDEGVFSRNHEGDRITAKIVEGEKPSSMESPLNPRHTTRGMSLEDLEKIALASNPTAAQADANYRAAATMAHQAGLYPNPTVGYYGDEIRGGSYGGGKQGGLRQPDNRHGRQATSSSQGCRSLPLAESKTAAELQRQRIVNNVRMLFYQTLAAQRLVEVRQRLVTLAEDSVQTGRQLANVGQADRPDVLQAEVEQQQAGIRLRIAQQNLAASWRALAAVAGKPDLPIVHLEGDLDAIPDLSYQQWLAATLAESPEMKLAEQSVAKAEAMFSQAKKAPIPDIEINANLSQDNEPLDSIHRPVGLTGGVQAGIRLPIFNRNQGNDWTAARERASKAPARN